MLDQDVLAATGHGRGDAESKPIRCGVKVVGRTGGGGGAGEIAATAKASYMIATTVASMTRARMGRGIQKAQISPPLPTARERSVGDKNISH